MSRNTTTTTTSGLVAKDAPPSLTVASRFAYPAEVSPSKMPSMQPSDSFVAKRIAAPTISFSSAAASSLHAARPTPFPGCVRQASLDEGFISTAVGASATALPPSPGAEGPSPTFASPASSSPRESADHFRHVPAASVEAALRGGNFKCGSALLDSLATPFREVDEEASRQRRKGPKKPPPRITLCPSTSSTLPCINNSPFVSSSSRLTRLPVENVSHDDNDDALRDIPGIGDDEDRCVSLCPDDPRLALGLGHSSEQGHSPSQNSSRHAKEKGPCPVVDSGHGMSRVTPLHSVLPTELTLGEEEVEDEVTELKAPVNLVATTTEEEEMDYFAVDEDKDTPLHVAVVEDEDAAAYIISKAKDPSQLNLHNKSWYSPIHLAAKVNNANSVRDLILGGANVTERDARGNTALHIACAKGHYEVVLALTRPLSHEDPVITEYKPPYQRLPHNLEIYNYDGLTCFQLAALHRRKRIMAELVRCGADTDAMEARSGRTALHFAVERHDMEVVKYLLQDCDVDVDAEAFDGSTALCLAEGRSYSSLAAFLRSYDADRDRGIKAFRQKEENGLKEEQDPGLEVSGYGSDYDSSESNLFGRY